MARVLIADDNPALLAAASRLLRDAGHEVTCTNSGADALCLLANKPPPDLMILDMVMPGLNGHDVLNALGPSAPPVVVISGDHINPTDFASGKVARVLTKPFDATALLKTISDVLSPCDSMRDTTVEKPPGVEMTEEERSRAHERYRRLNGGPAHAG
jgi:CheY-like chemotaxis protein